MPPTAASSLRKLRARRDEILEIFKQDHPTLVEELAVLDVAIASFEKGVGTTYQGLRGNVEAVRLCLKLNNAWMTKKQIVDALTEGGFPMKGRTGAYVVNDSINQAIDAGHFLYRKDEKRVGLPGWTSKIPDHK